MKRTPLKRKNRHASADSRWKQNVFALRGSVCMICSQPADDAHHIAHKGTWPWLRHDPKNGIPLCRGCHDWAHRNEDEFEAWLKTNHPSILAYVEAAKRRIK